MLHISIISHLAWFTLTAAILQTYISHIMVISVANPHIFCAACTRDGGTMGTPMHHFELSQKFSFNNTGEYLWAGGWYTCS